VWLRLWWWKKEITADRKINLIFIKSKPPAGGFFFVPKYDR
jgi:hypothetical protein